MFVSLCTKVYVNISEFVCVWKAKLGAVVATTATVAVDASVSLLLSDGVGSQVCLFLCVCSCSLLWNGNSIPCWF